MARRALTQATRFGVDFLSPQEVAGIEIEGTYKTISFKDGSQVKTKTVVISTGVDYRQLPRGLRYVRLQRRAVQSRVAAPR